jgi:MSHA biogenesis protein MshJ
VKALWSKYAARIDALGVRERVMVFIAALLVALYGIYLLSIEPAQRRQKVLSAQIVQQKQEIAALRALAQAGKARPVTDPDAANRARADELKRQIDALDETLKAMQRELVPAERMNALLRQMLTSEGGVQLVALRTLPAEPLVARSDKAAGAGAAASQPRKGVLSESTVYKHGVEITLQGSYVSLHNYLQRLEQSPWRMFWWRGRLAADDDARLSMTVTIYTLSLDRAWLQV